MNIDIERLRHDLIDYFGTAMWGDFPMAVVDVSKVESASSEELVKIAQKNGFSLYKYEV